MNGENARSWAFSMVVIMQSVLILAKRFRERSKRRKEISEGVYKINSIGPARAMDIADSIHHSAMLCIDSAVWYALYLNRESEEDWLRQYGSTRKFPNLRMIDASCPDEVDAIAEQFPEIGSSWRSFMILYLEMISLAGESEPDKVEKLADELQEAYWDLMGPIAEVHRLARLAEQI